MMWVERKKREVADGHTVRPTCADAEDSTEEEKLETGKQQATTARPEATRRETQDAREPREAEYLSGLGEVRQEIRRLSGRAQAIHALGRAEQANVSEGRARDLECCLPALRAGYALVDVDGFRSAVDASGLILYPTDLDFELAAVPDQVLREWKEAAETGLFEEFYLWGIGDVPDFGSPDRLVNMGGCVLGRLGEERFWVTGW